MLKMNFSEEAEETIKEICRYRNCSYAKALQYALGDERFFLEKLNKGYRVLIEKRGNYSEVLLNE